MPVMRNVGSADRAIRLILGAALLALGVSGVLAGSAAVVAAIIGALFLVTGVAKFCPFYSLIRFDTCSRRTGTPR